MPSWTLLRGLLCAAMLASAPQKSRAQTPTGAKAAAEAMFDRGLQLMREAKYAQACEQLEGSQALERGIGTMLYLAECYEKLGRIASAWALFREASSAARAAGQEERAAVGAQRADLLEPRLSRLIIRVDEGARLADLEVRHDGVVSPPAAWGVAIPVDPGTHTVTATAPGHESWEKQIEMEEGTERAMISIPPLTPLPSDTLAEATAPQVAVQPTASAVATQDTDSGTGQRIAGLAVGGAGVLALGLSAYFGLQAFSKEGDAERLCGGDQRQCGSEPGIAASEDAKAAATRANLFAVGGLAAVATGALLYVLAPDANETLAVSATPAGVALGGVF